MANAIERQIRPVLFGSPAPIFRPRIPAIAKPLAVCFAIGLIALLAAVPGAIYVGGEYPGIFDEDYYVTDQ